MQEEGIEGWGEIMRRFYELRKPNADAIGRLAVANFLEMRSKVVDPDFLRKKKIDAALDGMFPGLWMPLYSMVTFSTIPYAEPSREVGFAFQSSSRVGIIGRASGNQALK